MQDSTRPSLPLTSGTRRKPSIAAGALAALAVIAIGLAISALILHPVQRLTGYARDVRDGKPVVLPPLRAPRAAVPVRVDPNHRKPHISQGVRAELC